MFLLDGDDVTSFDDPEQARMHLEPFLVDEPVHLLDGLARPLRLVVTGDSRKLGPITSDGRRTVGLELASEEAQEVPLRRALSRYLRRIGEEPPEAGDILAFTLASRGLLAKHGE